MWQRSNWSTITVTAGYLAATLTGFARQSALAFYLGSGRDTDIFLVAFSIPEFFFIALPIILSPVVIPLFARVREQSGEKSAGQLAARLFAWFSAIFLGFILALWLLAPVYIPWLSPGFTAAQQTVSIALTRTMLLAVVLMGAAALAGAILQVFRSFARPAFITAVYNVVFTLSLFILPLPPVERACWGVIFGSLAALASQVPMLWKLLAPTRAWEWGGAAAVRFRELAWLILAFAAGYSIHHLILLVDRSMATLLAPGDAAALSYARNLSLVIVQVSGLAVSTVMFPALAVQMDQGAYDKVRAGLAAALRWVWAVAVPGTAVVVVLREPLVRFLFERGAFDSSATGQVSMLLAAYSLAALADALCQPMWRVVYAQGRPWAVVGINGLQTIFRIGINLAMIPWLGSLGLALSAALGLGVQALVLAVLVAGYLKIPLRSLWNKVGLRESGLVLLAAGISAALAGLLVTLLKSSLPAVVLLLVSGGAGAVLYAAVMWYFGNARSIWRGIKTI